MSITHRRQWADRLDRSCATIGAFLPAGLIVGKVGFEAATGLVGLCWLIRSGLVRENPFRRLISHPLILPWIVWYICIIVSLLVNGPGTKGWVHDLVFIRFLLCAMALVDISQRLPVAKYMLWGLIGGVIWSVANTFSAHAFGYDLLGKPLVRYTKKLKEAGRISALLAYAIPFFLAGGFFNEQLSKKEKFYYIFLGLIGFIILLLTRGRTTIIAALGAFFFCVPIFFRQRFSWKITLGIGLLLVTIGIALSAFLQNKHMLDLYNFYDRIYYWRVVWAMCMDHPLLGVGVSSFQDVYKNVAASGVIKPFVAPDGRIFNYGEVTHAHNLVLMLWSTTGLLGLGSFLWLFANATRSVFGTIKSYRPELLTWPIVFLIIGLTGFNIFNSEYQALFAFFIAFIGACFPHILPEESSIKRF